ncbi:DUF4390 domain-containing protein [Rhodoferax mekongensis]|uniref:DUF4390 domain-containing protein n=1 Tax=Rhodoferax mekongensis TaxID=3068341 RepID=A0ABZ0AZA6_9BURK|nr:DUF4390 domain-containing protein [Rhodoferax sp. TBRC 17307]WNO04958.1 DUF4390 domain-containing protein [Rhodoferax sp. TBRC 17307]
MTAFSMHFSKRNTFERLLRRLCLMLLICAGVPLHAQAAAELSQFDVERTSEELTLTAQLQFELSPPVEDALLKGIPVYFRVEAEVLKERWYWYDKSLASVTRQYKLAFQPLTRRWRLSVGTGSGSSAGQGLALSQTYDSLPVAIAAIKRIVKWRIAGPGELDPAGRYRFDFRFMLDVSQLPRPFQIGVLGQSDWDISVNRTVPVGPEAPK